MSFLVFLMSINLEDEATVVFVGSIYLGLCNADLKQLIGQYVEI